MYQLNRYYFFILVFACLQMFCLTSTAQDVDNMLHAKPVVIHGVFSVAGNYNAQSSGGSMQYSHPFNLIISANTNISIYGFSVPLSFMWSPQASSFQQPFNQFSLSPRYKWLQLYLGYQNLNFHPYTLAGQTVFGYGAEITPGKFKLGAIYGRFAKASAIDTVTQSLQPVNFARKGFAAHLGYGSASSYIDLSVIDAHDDSASLHGVDLNKLSAQYGQDIAPAYNLAAGIKARLAIGRHLYWEGIGGASIYTRDMRNSNYPESDLAIYKTVKQFVLINSTTEWYKAYQTAIGYTGNNWSLKFQYQYIDPDFRTMGAYNINNDIQNYTVAPSFYLFKKRLSFVSSFGIQTDNLNKLKSQTSKRFIANLALNAFVNKHLSVSGNFSNYSINVNPELKKIADTIRITQSNKNYSFTPVYTIAGASKTHSVIASANYNSMNDYSNIYAAGLQYRTINTLGTFINYSIHFIPADFTVQTGLNYVNTKGMGLTDQNQGLTLGLTKSFANKTFTGNISGSYLTGKRNGNDTRIYNGTAQISYTIKKHHRFSLNANTNNTTVLAAGGNQQISYSRVDIVYAYQF